MKNFILICSIVMLSSLSCYSQYSCTTAFEDCHGDTIAFPPVGTTAPVGPDYGDLDILTRPIWGYTMMCGNNFVSLGYEVLGQINTWPPQVSKMSMIVWGPFASKTATCNNLTASNIFLINDSVPISPTTYLSGLTSLTAGIGIYVFMIATNDTSPNLQLGSASLWSFGGGGNPIDCYLCNDEVTQLYQRTVCLITFDSTSQKTKLIWEKSPDAGVVGYIVYRTGSLSVQPDSVGYVLESGPAEFIDLTSHPLQYAEYYKVVPVDSCGNTYELQEYYWNFAGFLQTYPGGNNTVNLNWNNFGVSQLVNQYENVLYIHRGSSALNMQIIDTIPVGVVNYTDITAPPGQQYYAIERRRLFPCDPLRVSSSSNAYSSSMTNPSVSTVTGVPLIENDNIISVNPIPAMNILTINVSNTMVGYKMSLVDISGKIVKADFITNTTELMDVSDLSAGTYWISITGKEKIVKKIIVGK